MKLHSINYRNTLIEIAEDTKALCAVKPPHKEPQTVAEIQYELIADNPYKYTSDDVLFRVYAIRNDFPESDYEAARRQFFSKGQPCLRTSPLAKTYGFGIYSNDEEKVALVGMGTEAYQRLLEDSSVRKVKAMKASR